VRLSGILCRLNQLLFAEVINNLLTGNLIMFEVAHVMITHWSLLSLSVSDNQYHIAVDDHASACLCRK